MLIELTDIPIAKVIIGRHEIKESKLDVLEDSLGVYRARDGRILDKVALSGSVERYVLASATPCLDPCL